MHRRRILASIEHRDGADVVRVYEQTGDDVERVAWVSGQFDSVEVVELLGTPDLVPRGRSGRPGC